MRKNGHTGKRVDQKSLNEEEKAIYMYYYKRSDELYRKAVNWTVMTCLLEIQDVACLIHVKKKEFLLLIILRESYNGKFQNLKILHLQSDVHPTANLNNHNIFVCLVIDIATE